MKYAKEARFDRYFDGTKSVPVEGRLSTIQAHGSGASGIEVMRKYQSLVEQVGGVKVVEAWAPANFAFHSRAPEHSESYFLTVVEKKPIEVKASLLAAEAMKQELDSSGHVTLCIHFDFDKADIRSDSQAVVDEIAKLMSHPDLKLTVEGHTDDLGRPDYNRRLSAARAASVVAAVSGKGVDAQRLQPVGIGPDRPLADNARAREACCSPPAAAAYRPPAPALTRGSSRPDGVGSICYGFTWSPTHTRARQR